MTKPKQWTNSFQVIRYFLFSVMFLGCLMFDQVASAMAPPPPNNWSPPAVNLPPVGPQVSGANDQLCGFGPDIEGFTGDSEIQVRPMGAPYNDAENVQWAVDNVASGGRVVLCEGVFNFGLGHYEGKSVMISKGLTIIGKKVGGEWLSVIEGGEKLKPLFPIPDPEIGPFFVYSPDDPNPVIFKKVWIRKFKSEAILVKGVNTFKFIDSKLTDPIAGSPSPVLLLGSFVHAIAATSPESKGNFILKHNDIDLSWKPGNGVKPSDTQFTGVYGRPLPAFTKIVVSNNKIVSPDEAIEIISNDAGKTSKIFVENNDIDVDFDVAGILDPAMPFPGQYAIIVTGNRDTSKVYIRNNEIDISSKMKVTVSSGLKLMAAFGINGENFLVENNRVHFNDFPGNAINIGGFGNLLPSLSLGTSLYYSTIRNNTFTGKLDGAIIKMAVLNLFPNYTRHNDFHIEDSLNAKITVDARGSFACRNDISGDVNWVLGFPERPCFVHIEPIGGWN